MTTTPQSLFNKYECFTPDGIELSDKAHSKIKELMQEYADRGFSIRDIGHIVSLDIPFLRPLE